MKSKPGVFQRSLFGGESVPGQGTLFDGLTPVTDPGARRLPEQQETTGCKPDLGQELSRDLEAKAPAGDRFAGIDDLALLRQLVLKCRQCSLRQGARGVVFGEGNPEAEIMFVGEGPGKTEDEMGRPFVGRAGQLLDLMLKSHGFSREETFIANIVKCRPPGNRLPSPDEVQACLPNLMAQIRIIRPKIIVALGALASQTLINPGLRVTRDRGKWFEKDGISYLVTFHPAAVLRDERNKRRLIWEDFLSLKQKHAELCR
ncbi:MAG: uracil-DNA glycosylase [Bacillota bacterium]